MTRSMDRVIEAVGARPAIGQRGSTRALLADATRAGLLAAALAVTGCSGPSVGEFGDDKADEEPVVVARLEPAPESRAAAADRAAPCPSPIAVPERRLVRGSAKGDLAAYRDQARADAMFVSAACARNGRCDSRHDFYRMLYNRAATAFEVMIDNMAARTEKEARFDDSLYGRYTIKEAAVQLYLLERAFAKIREDAKCGPAGSATAAAVGPQFIDRTEQRITGIFVRLAGTYRNSAPHQRRQFLDQLGALRWSRFEELQRVATGSADTR